jgi:RNA-directed DNA polymerase
VDRAKQALFKSALEPQGESRFEPTSYGFRPGRKPADAIKAIWNSLFRKAKWVLDADIEKCFDRIDHEYLLKKLGYETNSLIYQQIHAWLKAGILERGQPFPGTNPGGTPQGGVISPLLANIALDGMIESIAQAVEKHHGKQAVGNTSTSIGMQMIL